ncbi:MAG: HD-GYP domain-containing protein [Gemmataceae bacterium]
MSTWHEEYAGVSSLDDSLETLERLGQILPLRDDPGEQIRLTLEAIRDCLDAEVVFYYPGSNPEPYKQVGTTSLTAEWAGRFVAEAASQEGEILHWLDPAARPEHLWPTSGICMRMSRSRNSWLAVLSFHPRRLFQPTDLRLALLARRLLLSRRKQGEFDQRLRGAMIDLVRCLASQLDGRSSFWQGHSERVGLLSMELGKRMELPGNMAVDLYLAGLLHDIGRISLPERYLTDRGPRNMSDEALMREHTLFGDQLVASIHPLRHLWPAVRHHHEWWNGSGYPDGLVGEEIPFMARVLAVADACVAMASPRPFRRPHTLEQIVEILRAGSGTQWDPKIVETFLSEAERFFRICQEKVATPPPVIIPTLDSEQGLVP